MFWGPQNAIEFIRRQRLMEERLDEVWREAGVLVSLDSQELLLFGSEDLQ